MQKSMDTEAVEEAIDFTLQTTDTAATRFESKTPPEIPEVISEVIPEVPVQEEENLNKVYVSESGFLLLHEDHPDYFNLIRLQLENQELMNWKTQLQGRINAERAECVRLKKVASVCENSQEPQTSLPEEPEFEKIVDHYQKENALLEQKRILLAKEILDENISLIQLQVDLAMKQFVH